jgi:hypothetical protein
MPHFSSTLARLALYACAAQLLYAIAIALSPSAAAPPLRTDMPIKNVPITNVQPCCEEQPPARVWVDPYARSVSRDVPMAAVGGC